MRNVMIYAFLALVMAVVVPRYLGRTSAPTRAPGRTGSG